MAARLLKTLKNSAGKIAKMVARPLKTLKNSAGARWVRRREAVEW
jgi:hypothetical protein